MSKSQEETKFRKNAISESLPPPSSLLFLSANSESETKHSVLVQQLFHNSVLLQVISSSSRIKEKPSITESITEWEKKWEKKGFRVQKRRNIMQFLVNTAASNNTSGRQNMSNSLKLRQEDLVTKNFHEKLNRNWNGISSHLSVRHSASVCKMNDSSKERVIGAKIEVKCTNRSASRFGDRFVASLHDLMSSLSSTAPPHVLSSCCLFVFPRSSLTGTLILHLQQSIIWTSYSETEEFGSRTGDSWHS